MFAEYAAGLQSGDAVRLRRAEELSARSQVLMKEMQNGSRDRKVKP
jgi:hypothetical protein